MIQFFLMLVFVANLGSTSFKFKLLDMSNKNGEVIARGGYERIGQPGSPHKTHGDVIDEILKTLGRIPDAIGFKAVHGGPISGAVRVNDEVIATMEHFTDVAPAHNPPYIAAMKALRQRLPNVPQVAAFETAFHQTIPQARQVYAILSWRFASVYCNAHERNSTKRAESDQLSSGWIVLNLCD